MNRGYWRMASNQPQALRRDSGAPRDIRSATPEDAPQLRAIYAPYVTNTCVSFETEVPSVAEFAQRIKASLSRWAYLVCEARGEIVGYAYAGPYRARAAYRYSANVSVYIKPDYHRQGIGKALYEALFEQLRNLGFYTLVAGLPCQTPPASGCTRRWGSGR